MKASTHEIGVGLRPTHFSHFQVERPRSVSWVEVISENFMDWRHREIPGARKRLLGIRENVPVSLHGVSLSLGSAEALDEGYLRSLKNLVNIINPESVSDHLCWTGIGGINSHDLLPLPYTEEAIAVAVAKIGRVQDFLGRHIAVENLSSYVTFTSSEMTEWDFVSEVVRRSGCKLILDVNNVYVSSVNHRFDPYDYLRGIDPKVVEHIHLAGHTVKQDGSLIDTHDTPVCNDVWNLYRFVVRSIPGPRVMLERDGNIPEWEGIESELAIIERIQREELYVATI
jgi:uncharacterized protein (UPF0276 family)